MSDENELRRSDGRIRADVEEGLRLHSIIEAAKVSLKRVTERLAADALARPDEHKPLIEGSREGRRWVAPGELTVVITADTLVGSFLRNSETHAAIVDNIAGYVRESNPELSPADANMKTAAIFNALFSPWDGFERTLPDGHQFREAVRGRISAANAEAVIDALKDRDEHGVPKNAVKIEWKDAAMERILKAAEKELRKRLTAEKKEAKKAGKTAVETTEATGEDAR